MCSVTLDYRCFNATRTGEERGDSGADKSLVPGGEQHPPNNLASPLGRQQMEQPGPGNDRAASRPVEPQNVGGGVSARDRGIPYKVIPSSRVPPGDGM